MFGGLKLGLEIGSRFALFGSHCLSMLISRSPRLTIRISLGVLFLSIDHDSKSFGVYGELCGVALELLELRSPLDHSAAASLPIDKI